MDTWYWALEYVRVFFAYVMILFVLAVCGIPGLLKRQKPHGAVCFLCDGFGCAAQYGGTKSGRVSYTVRMADCRAVLRHIAAWLAKMAPRAAEQIKKISRLFLGTYGIRLLLLRLRNRVKDGIGHVHAQFRQSIRGRRCVYLMLGVVVCFGMVYFSYGAFHDYSYGFGDMYRHHSWIYGLLNGTPFYEGIYPEAMHCFIYAMRVLFGVKIYSSQLFLAGIHVAVFLVSAYLLLKELFAWGWNRGACTGVVPDRGSFVH